MKIEMKPCQKVLLCLVSVMAWGLVGILPGVQAADPPAPSPTVEEQKGTQSDPGTVEERGFQGAPMPILPLATIDPQTTSPLVLGTATQTVQIPGPLSVNGGREAVFGPIMQVMNSPIGGGIVANNLYVRQLNQTGGPAHLCWKPAPDGVQALLLTICSTSQSSLRYKTDVQPFVGGLDVVNRLNPVNFAWKENGARDIGLVAEEVAMVEPLLTFKNHKDELEGVKYETLGVVLINALKEQQAQIEELRQRLQAQQDQLNQYAR